MPRVHPIYSDFFYEPLTEDVEELLGRFQQTDSVRYEVFSALWRDMSFSDVFAGLGNYSEARRFCRVALATAAKFFLPPYSYQIRTGGLYLLFAFFHTQPASPPLRIRLALKDWTHVEMFLRDSVRAQHYDVVFVYEKLAAEKAFHYAAMPHLLCFQRQIHPKKHPECPEFLRRSAAVQDLLPADLMEEVRNIQSHYEKLKEDTEQVSSRATMTLPDFHQRLQACMSEFLTWQEKTYTSKAHKSTKEDEDSAEEEDEEGEESCSKRRARLLSSIKQRSYNSFQKAPRSRRHRHAEIQDGSSSSAEQGGAPAPPLYKRPPSLRARTWMSLGKDEKDSKAHAWLLSVPEQLESMQVKRFRRTTPFKL
ncbi:snRNA-activating protein complex subunit 1 [Oryzias latipes]|uniref:snRNA-activating protein complex subunit 1 n=1 Tax=Oryzias latipes TaxID=8090 RepID=UPI0002A4A939|nr:snRNA-activating protein complex subunit 1 [Oryzias latipes]